MESNGMKEEDGLGWNGMRDRTNERMNVQLSLLLLLSPSLLFYKVFNK